MSPALSVVVVAFDLPRELPRTLRSLCPGYQRGIEAGDYELIVVDNGSPRPVADTLPAELRERVRLRRIESASASPVGAANLGLGLAGGRLVGLFVDGARIASPGLLAGARLAARLADRAVIASLGWHLGPAVHMDAETAGYDRSAEDRLLAESGWEADGYRLFEISTLAASSRRGWFGPLGESNALFMARGIWEELGGLDEGFQLPGGGLANHDLYRRACELPGAELVVLLGEGTFHQLHGGAATSRRVSRDQAWADYEALRGTQYEPPDNQPLYLGRMPPQALPHLEHSLRWARGRAS